MSIISGVGVCAVGLALIALGQHFAIALAVSLGTATLVGGLLIVLLAALDHR